MSKLKDIPPKMILVDEWMYQPKTENGWTTINAVPMDFRDENMTFYSYMSRKDDNDLFVTRYPDETVHSRKWMMRFFQHRCSACGEVKYLDEYGFNYHKHKWDDVCKDCKPIIQATKMDKFEVADTHTEKVFYRKFSDALYRYKVVKYDGDYVVLDTGERIHKDVVYRTLHSMYIYCSSCGAQIVSEKQISQTRNAGTRRMNGVCRDCANGYFKRYYEENKDTLNKKRNKIKK